MDDLQPIRRASATTGVSRTTITLWVKDGLLKSRKGKFRHMQTTLVSVAAVKSLAAKRRPGRPKESEAA